MKYIVVLSFLLLAAGCATAKKPQAGTVVNIECSSSDKGNIKGFFIGNVVEIRIVKGSCREAK